jgi:integrase
METGTGQQTAWTNLRMRLVASLVIFQGLHSGELEKLTVQDIDLDKGTVYVPATGSTNSRVIALNQSQRIQI